MLRLDMVISKSVRIYLTCPARMSEFLYGIMSVCVNASMSNCTTNIDNDEATKPSYLITHQISDCNQAYSFFELHE